MTFEMSSRVRSKSLLLWYHLKDNAGLCELTTGVLPVNCASVSFPLSPSTDMMGLKRMMEKLGVPKTHLELKKMMGEVTGGNSNTINYRDFVKMMLGKRSAVLKL